MSDSARYISHSKDFPSDLNNVRDEVKNALAAGVQRVHRHPSSKGSVYMGGTGAVLMDWTLSDFADVLPILKDTISLSKFSLSAIESGARASFLETSVGTAALKLASHLRLGPAHAPSAQPTAPSQPQAATKEQETCAFLIRDALRLAIEEDIDDGGCEVLYGRAGLLYSLLFLRAQAQVAGAGHTPEELARDARLRLLGQLCAEKNVNALVHNIVARGKTGARLYREELPVQDRSEAPPLMWMWHGKRYLGGAHGVVGILQMLLAVPPRIVGQYWDMILETIEWLLAIQQPSGNWPHKASREMHAGMDEDESDQLVQWCHGAPAVLILLSTLITRFGSLAPSSPSPTPAASLTLPRQLEDACRVALSRGGKVVYERGLLRKGVGLCHGAAGSVYALLAVSDALDRNRSAPPVELELGDRPWFRRAAHLALLACAYERLTKKGEMSIPDRPYSLYEGVAGMCCAWAEVVRRVEGRPGAGRGMPGYSDLPEFTD